MDRKPNARLFCTCARLSASNTLRPRIGLTLFVDETKIPDVQIEQAEQERLLEQLYAENETISFLLKAHLSSEYWLDRLLAEYLEEKREPLERMSLRFAQKLSLVDSFALLPVECVQSLAALNKLRNDCVHTFNNRPTLEDVRKVGFKLADFQRAADSLQTVGEFLKAYMLFLLGYFSAAKYLARAILRAERAKRQP